MRLVIFANWRSANVGTHAPKPPIEQRLSKPRSNCLAVATLCESHSRMVNGFRLCILLSLFAMWAPGQDIVLSGATVSSGTLSYQPSGAITAGPNYVINGPAVVTFAAGTQVNLEPGFEVVASSGSLFDARSGVQISGQILVNGTGMSGAAVTLTGTTANGTTVGQTVITNSTGAYVLNVPIGGTYALVAALTGYLFTPASQTFSNVSTAIQAQSANASAGSSSSPPPIISGLSLPSGPPLMGFVINGNSFGASQGGSTVVVNGTSLTVINWTPTTITVQIPSGIAAGNGTINVTVGGQSATTGFTVSAPFGCSS